MIEKLRKENYLFLGISPLHSEDVYEDGDNVGKKKKAHYHCVVRYKDAVYSSAISKRTGIPHQYKIFEKTISFRSSVRYLTHLDDPEKFQYSIDDVWVSDWDIYMKCVGDLNDEKDSESEYIIFKKLWNACLSGHFQNVGELTLWALGENYNKVYNRYKWVFIEFFRDLNRKTERRHDK